mmetsp:Transcript_124465/g.311216  ORF Transcript_124465/g.311216 Transcript_124465/m.311216 type:complete len:219 (-) Transcript_124465:49-705(-)
MVTSVAVLLLEHHRTHAHWTYAPRAHSLGVRLLELIPSLHVPLHLQPHGEEAHSSAEEVAQVAHGDPPIRDEHDVAELPEAVEPISEPTRRHGWAAVVVPAWAVVDPADGGDAAGAVLLARVADGFNDLLFGGDGCHALADVLDGVRERLRRLQLHCLEAWCPLGRHLAVPECLLRADGPLRRPREDAVAEIRPRSPQRQADACLAEGHGCCCRCRRH